MPARFELSQEKFFVKMWTMFFKSLSFFVRQLNFVIIRRTGGMRPKDKENMTLYHGPQHKLKRKPPKVSLQFKCIPNCSCSLLESLL